MPIPTDTFWNIKKLNWVFAISSVALVVVTLWSVVQDYDKTWRRPQQNGRVWEAAITNEKIQRAMSETERAKLEDLRNLVNDFDNQVKSGHVQFAALAGRVEVIEKKYAAAQVLTPSEQQNLAEIKTLLTDQQKQKELARYSQLTKTIQDRAADVHRLTFRFNNDKAELTVKESQLQDARTEGNAEKVKQLEKDLEAPRAKLAEDQRRIFGLQREAENAKEERAKAVKPVEDLRKLTAKLGGDVELLRKKLAAIQPGNMAAKLSSAIRRAPLLQFMNPEDKVREVYLQDILSDLSFTKVATTDRCATCHVHIDRKDFAEEKMLSYLEEQLASGRNVRFSAAKKAEDPTEIAPGAAGMPEFWHLWGQKLLPAIQQRANKARVNNIIAIIGEPGVTVTYDKKPRQKFEYKPGAANADEQNAIVLAVIDALYKYEKPASGKKLAAEGQYGNAVVKIDATFDEAKAGAARDEAFAYPVEIRKAIVAALSPKEYNLLEERYRFVLVENVNVFRDRDPRGLKPLDPSPVLLAHPRLDLYADVDSPHPMEAVGCTSCHDGSGQETDFILAAHTARDVWVDKFTGLPVLPQQIDLKANGLEHEEHAPDMSDLRETVLSGDATALHFDHLAPGNGKGHNGHRSAPATQPTTQPSVRLGKIEHRKLPHATAEAHPLQYKDPLTGQTRTAVAQIQYWASKYERESGTSIATVNHEWDWPMRTPDFIQANCARCHTGVHEIRKEAPILYEGRTLFAKLGCVNCHQMDSIPAGDKRQVGPDLRHVNAKLSNAFLDSWIWAPKAFRPSTMMPHFFMLENNSSDEELRRTQQEVRAIQIYLPRTATPMAENRYLQDLANKMPEGEGDVERGRALFIGFDADKAPIGDMQGGVGCIGCHTNLNETGQRWITNDLAKSGQLDEYLAEFSRKAVEGGGSAPSANALRQEANREALRRYRAMTYNERQLYAMENFGEAIGASGVPKYADGTPKPVFQHHGPELSSIGTKLTAGRSKDEARKWLYNWLIDPRHYSSYTVMPRLRLSPQDALDLTEYLLAQRRMQAKAGDDPWKAKEIAPDPDKVSELVAQLLLSKYPMADARKAAADDKEISALAATALTNKNTTADEAKKIVEQMPLEEKQLVFLGQKMINHYGCFNCHAINGMEGAASPCANLSEWGQNRIEKLDFGFLTHHKITELPKDGSKIPMVNGLSTASVTDITDALNAKKWAQPLA